MDFDLSLPSEKGMQVPVAETHCHSYMYSKKSNFTQLLLYIFWLLVSGVLNMFYLY